MVVPDRNMVDARVKCLKFDVRRSASSNWHFSSLPMSMAKEMATPLANVEADPNVISVTTSSVRTKQVLMKGKEKGKGDNRCLWKRLPSCFPWSCQWYYSHHLYHRTPKQSKEQGLDPTNHYQSAQLLFSDSQLVLVKDTVYLLASLFAMTTHVEWAAQRVAGVWCESQVLRARSHPQSRHTQCLLSKVE